MINSVRLENFKNFRDATLTLGPLTVIVGTNASGKSNLRDAFRFLHGIGRGYSLADIVGEKYVDGFRQWSGIRGGARDIAHYGVDEFEINICLANATEPDRFIYSIRVNSNRGHLRVVNEFLLGRGQRIFDVPQDEQYSQHRLHIETASGDSIGFSSLRTVLSELADSDFLAPEIETEARLANESIRSMRFLDLVPEAMKHPSIPGQPLGDRGENLSSALLAICEDENLKRAMMEWIRQLTPLDVVDFEFPSDPAGRVLVSLLEANGNKTSAYSASDGTLRFLALIAALMAPDAAQFYFLEEIDNGIHPTRLNLLLQLIEQQTKKGKIQVVTTTHSPQLLAMLSEESREHAYLVYRAENEPDAQLQRIVDIPGAREVLKKQSLARLHESGWLENTMDFTRNEEPAA
jgi:hypothetical protein